MAKVKDAFGQFVGIFRKSGSDEPTPEEVAQKEAYAMNTFRYRLTNHRSTYGAVIPQAPGFDYVNWKPHGKHRINKYNDDDFHQRAYRLAPYVHSVVNSGVEGLEERRWAGLTGPPPPYIPTGRTPRWGMSAMGSRSGSREYLG